MECVVLSDSWWVTLSISLCIVPVGGTYPPHERLDLFEVPVNRVSWPGSLFSRLVVPETAPPSHVGSVRAIGSGQLTGAGGKPRNQVVAISVV
jgi:hypothetical protein